MKQRRNLIPALGFVLWSGIIMLFDRHDLGFYAASFLFSATITFLALANSRPKYIEIEVEGDKNA